VRCVLLRALAATVASAQSPQQHLVQAAAGVYRGSTIRITVGDQRLIGRFDGLREDTLMLIRANSVMGVPLRGSDTLWVRHRATKRGALIGGALGAVTLTGFGILLLNGLCDTADGCKDDYPGVITFGVLIGGGGGALLGAGLGALSRSWRRVHP
jgi:hypothetical protein